jgi:transcriptional regulator with XRE-family HTH domain
MTISLKRMDELDQDAADASSVGGRIRSIRQTVGYSIDNLAETCGLTGQEITDIEDGQDADPARLKRIAAALQVTVESLVNGQD